MGDAINRHKKKPADRLPGMEEAMSICFVTDSAADIPAELVEELGIQVLPFHIAMEGKDLRDGADFTPQEFYHALLSAPKIPTHSQHTAFVFQECYEKAWRDGYSDLIYTAINSKGSTTHANAVQAIELFYEDFPEARDALRIRVIDGGDYTMTYGWAVVLGARMAREGKNAEEVAAAIQDWVDHSQVVFGLYDLKFAKKSGRVSAAAAFVGDALGLKPIMTFQDGESKILTKVRGEKNVIPAILDQIKPAIDPDAPYLCLGGALEAENKLVCAASKEAFGKAPELFYYIGGVIAINAGPNLVGVVFRKKGS